MRTVMVAPEMLMPEGAMTWVGSCDLFRVGIGPSSSHMTGPMLTVARFVAEMPAETAVESLKVELFSSLA